jgi:adenylate cyclase
MPSTRPSAAMSASLHRSDTGESFPLEAFNLIGRGEDATLRLVHGSVSRRHATLRQDGTQYWLSDLGSVNGTYLNQVAVTTARAVEPGDSIQFGTVACVFHQERESEGAGPAGDQTQVVQAIGIPVQTLRATLLVGDLKGYSALSAQVGAESVADLLREWYADCERVLQPRGAIIDKYIGDAVFAYWLSDDPETRFRALEAARLLSGPPILPAPVRARLNAVHGTDVSCHLGLNVGSIALGAMGRSVNTAVGESVNLTFRIEALTRDLGVRILAGSAFVAGVPALLQELQSLGIHPLKGQPEPVEVYGEIPRPSGTPD